MADARDPGQYAHRRLLQDGQDLTLDDLFHHERDGDEDVGLHVCEGGHQRRGAGGLAEEEDVAAAAQGIEELEGQAEHVRHRQHGERGVVVGDADVLERIVDVGAEAAAVEHHALRVAGGAGGIVDDRERVEVAVIMDVGFAEAVRIGLGELCLGAGEGVGVFRLAGPEAGVTAQADDGLQVRDLAGVQVGEDALIREENDALRVVGQALDRVGGEIVEDRDRDGVVGGGGKEGHRPAGGVLSAESDAVAGPDPEVMVGEVEFLQFGRHLGVAEVVTFIITERGTLPFGERHIFEVREKMFHNRFSF